MSIDTNEEPFYGLGFGIAMFVFAILGMLSSAICFLYINFKLKLNCYLKWILRVTSLIVFACNLIMIIAFLALYFEGSPKIIYCAMITYGYVIGGSVSVNTSTVISSVRLVMYKKSLEARFANPIILLAIIIGGILFNLIFMFSCMYLVLTYKISGAVLKCANLEPDITVPIFGAIFPLSCFFQSILGLYFDWQLKTIMTKKQKASGHQLVPWNVNAGSTPEEDLKIPTNATIFAAITGIMAIVVAIVLNMGNVLGWNSLRWVSRILTEVYAVTHLPVMLTFTMKHQKAQDPSQKQPPKGLQFHGEIPGHHDLHFHEDIHPGEESNQDEENQGFSIRDENVAGGKVFKQLVLDVSKLNELPLPGIVNVELY